MDIECILKREGGSKIDLDGTTYHFKPNTVGAHVADVEDKAHRNRFLAISEGYQIYDGALMPNSAGKNENPTVLNGSDNFPATFEIAGNTYSLGDIVAKAYITAGLTPEAWNELPVEDRDALIDAELDSIAEANAGGDSTDAELEAAKAAYKQKFGKLPHYRWSVEKITEALAE
jgi:hypothetical protein